MGCCCRTRTATPPPAQRDRQPDALPASQKTAAECGCDKAGCDCGCAKGWECRCECRAAA